MEIMVSQARSSANNSPRQKSIGGEWVGFKAVVLIVAAVSVVFVMFGSIAEHNMYSREPTKERKITLMYHEALEDNGNGTNDHDDGNEIKSNYEDVDMAVPFYMYPRTEEISYHIIQVH